MAFVPLNTQNSDLANYNNVNNALRDLTGKVKPLKTPSTGWIAPTFTNSWVNYGSGFNDAGYYKDALGFVHLKGLIKSGTVGSSAFTLPVGLRPQATELLGTVSNGAVGRVDIATSGTVTPTSPSNNTWVALDGLTFRAYQ